MKKNVLTTLAFFLVLSLLHTGCGKGPDNSLFRLEVLNESSLALTDQLLEVNLSDLEKPVPDSLLERMILNPDQPLPWQLADDDRNGVPDRLLILADLQPGEEMQITASPGDVPGLFPQRTQAEISVKTGGTWKDRKYIGGSFENVEFLRVPPEHTDHSFYIRYEGPGWESDLVGFRFYLDWRNAIDVFGKQTENMVLQNVGQDGFDSYHEQSDWGMDILKVGESLGLGTIGIWADGKANRVAVTDSVTCRIIANGPIYSEIETNYYGWQAGDVKTDMRSILSISAGSRLTKHQVSTSVALENFCTGIVSDKNAVVIVPEAEKEGWSYLATWGKQSLANDNLGLAVIYRSSELAEITKDTYSNVIVLKPSGKSLTYYFLAVWEKEPGGITSQEAFVKYLEETLKRLDNPPAVEVIP
jgi:hypothetical protein